jgi:peptidoglycan/xylan/chitin deacetylase (PgdA/CDA1 family)
MKIVALKIYVDSTHGYQEGVPRLLDVFGAQCLEASFFFGMGADDDRQTRQVFSSEWARSEKDIVASAPGIIRDARSCGHDCGIYGWNPREWQSRFEKMNDTTVEANIKRSIKYFSQRTGTQPNGFAAPGFRVNYIILRILDDLRFKYGSDTFGHYPYRPRISWKTFETPQIPSTHPPLEIMLQKLPEAEIGRASCRERV